MKKKKLIKPDQGIVNGVEQIFRDADAKGKDPFGEEAKEKIFNLILSNLDQFSMIVSSLRRKN